MRPADVAEVTACGHTPKQALRLGLVGSEWAMTAKVDGKPEAMFGLVVQSAMGGEGAPWFLGTEEVYRHPREMIRMGPVMLRRMLDSTPRLENVVGTFNAPAIRLLRAWGCHIGKEVIMFAGAEFVTFSLETSDL